MPNSFITGAGPFRVRLGTRPAVTATPRTAPTTELGAEAYAHAALRGQWVAIDPQAQFGRVFDTPLSIKLVSGAVVVDADVDLDVLCQRLNAERRTSLTILFVGRE